MKKITIKSPAKINFGLNIVSKREDGFHNLETIFYPISLCDLMIFEKSDSFYFETDSEELNTTLKDNLIMKSVKLMEQASRKKINVRIRLEKYMPIGAGLGGGSSNAATTMVSLNELLHLNISTEKMKELALKIGSDVPFFFKPKPFYAEGRGEILNRINFNITKPILLVNPNIHISTKWAYSLVTPKKSDVDLASLEKMDIQNYSELNGIVLNDFEEPVFAKYPELRMLKEKLYELNAEFALMTGSGSTLFAIFPDLPSAEKAKDSLPANYFRYIHFEDISED